VRIVLDGLTARISLSGCEPLLAPLAAVLGSWRFRQVETNSQLKNGTAVISVRREQNRYRIASPWLDEPVVEQTEVGAVFSLVAEIACAFAAENAKSLCLHCAAVESDGHLVLFPNSENAGKSTLAARLAAQGLRLFVDDVLPISENGREGVSLGIAPRLRLPLPSSAGALFRAFTDTHRGPCDEEFLYLTLPASRLAAHGQAAPLGAAVLLDRQRSGRATLTPLSRGPALRQLIIQNFAPKGTSIATLDHLRRLIERTACFTLTYSNLDEAAALLIDRFSATHAPWRQKRADQAGIKDRAISIEVASDARQSRAICFAQATGVTLRAVGDDIFLVKPGEPPIFHLNTVAASLWRLLERPTTLAAAIDAVRQAFPQANARQVERDVRAVFATLQEDGLIQVADRQASRAAADLARPAGTDIA
jgi:ribosomal protein L34